MDLIDLIVDFGNWLWGWYDSEANQNKSNAIAAALAVIIPLLVGLFTFIWKVAKRLLGPGKSGDGRGMATPANQAAPPPGGIVTMALADFEARLQEREDRVRAELETAGPEESEVLRAQLSELQRQKDNPGPALEEAQARIAELEALLERMGNEIGADKLAEARAALEKLDYSVADALFAEVEERQKLEVQQAARAAFGRGEIAEAEARWTDAAAHYARAARLDPSFETLRKAREFASRSGDYPAALRLGEKLLALAREEGDAARLANALNDHALSLRTLGNNEEAEPLFREALDIAEKALGKDHPDYATGLNNLALLLHATGRTAEAEPLFREALEIAAKSLGKDHPDYALRLNNLALLRHSTGRNEEAEPLFREAMEITGKTLGVEHPYYANILHNLAVLHARMQRFDEALPLMERALAIREAKLGAEHPDTVASRQSLAAMRTAAQAGQGG